ncbi:hypothetical protein [Hyphomicrobium sp.]|uniref:hypothetical protein n=1 Tax=Hyphomicrobium sp. TaxID=82 RepID=UPI003FA600F0
MPNTFAFIVLFSWPAVAWILFRTLPLSKALVWTMLGGYLILPSATSVKVPMMPLIDKGLVPTVSAAITLSRAGILSAVRHVLADDMESAAAARTVHGLDDDLFTRQVRRKMTAIGAPSLRALDPDDGVGLLGRSVLGAIPRLDVLQGQLLDPYARSAG